MDMSDCLHFSSMTTAMHAQKLLQRNNISSNIKRVVSQNKCGCGYCLNVKGNAQKAGEILRSAGVKFKTPQEIENCV
jgi:hypothetical protein